MDTTSLALGPAIRLPSRRPFGAPLVIGILLACLALLVSPITVRADVDLKLPTEPEHDVKLPGPGVFTGARLYAPQGAGPFPAVVLSHTCGPLRQHMFEWAQRFVAAGYVALVVDHLGPRGVTSNCWPHFGVSVTEYAQDAVAGVRHLRSMTLVDGSRTVLMGFSYGAMAALRVASEGFRKKSLGGDGFAAVVAVYPWCNDRRGGVGHQDHQWNFHDDTTTPLLVLLGAADDDADPRSCIDKAKANAAKGMPVEFRVFPGTTHAFDHSLMGDKAAVVQQGGRTITHRYNRESVEAAWTTTLAFLRRRLPSPPAR